MIKAQSLKKSGLISIALATMGKLLSFSTTLAVAYIFGANTQTDLIFFLYSTIILLSGFWTHFNSNILLPYLVKKFEENPDLAWQKCCAIATKVLISMLLLIPVLCFFYPHVFSLISRWSPETIHSTYNFFLILILLLPIIYLNDLFCVVYQSQKHFTYTYLNSLCFGFTCLIFIYIFSSSLAEYSLALGMLTAGAMQLLIMFIIMQKSDLKFRLVFKSIDKELFNWHLWLSSLLLFSCQFLLIFLPDYFATGLQQGSFTSILNGRKVVEIMTTLIMFPVILIFYPRMVEWHKSNSPGFKLQLVVKILIWLCIPLICLMTLLGPLIIEYFFHNGSYTKAHTLISQISLLTLTPGIFFISLFSLTTRWILAQKSSSILIHFCLLLVTVSILSWPLFNYLTYNFEESGLLWSQLILQSFGYGGVSLFFLIKTKGFSLKIFVFDLLASTSLFSPGIIIYHLTENLFTGFGLTLVAVVGFIALKKVRIVKLLESLEQY